MAALASHTDAPLQAEVHRPHSHHHVHLASSDRTLMSFKHDACIQAVLCVTADELPI